MRGTTTKHLLIASGLLLATAGCVFGDEAHQAPQENAELHLQGPELNLALPPEVNSIFFNGANGVACGVIDISEDDWIKQCKDRVFPHPDPNSANEWVCRSNPAVSFRDIKVVRSGSYCEGAFHSIGWPESLCPAGKRMQRADEVDLGMDLGCGIGMSKKRMDVFCGFRYVQTNSTCRHVGFGIDQAKLSPALNSGDPKVVVSAELIQAYGQMVRNNTNLHTNLGGGLIKTPTYGKRNRADLKLLLDLVFFRALLLSYNEPNYLTAADQAKSFINGQPLYFGLSSDEFALGLNNAGMRIQ